MTSARTIMILGVLTAIAVGVFVFWIARAPRDDRIDASEISSDTHDRVDAPRRAVAESRSTNALDGGTHEEAVVNGHVFEVPADDGKRFRLIVRIDDGTIPVVAGLTIGRASLGPEAFHGGEGAVPLSWSGSPASIIVEGRFPERIDLVPKDGVMTVVLKAAASVAGVVTIDGKVPDEGVFVSASVGDDRRIDFGPRPTNQDGPAFVFGVYASCRVGAFGSFRISGLERGQKVLLFVRAYDDAIAFESVVDDARGLLVTAPAENVTLAVRRAPTVIGRAVDRNHDPVTPIFAMWGDDDHSVVRRSAVPADPTGAFRITVPRGMLGRGLRLVGGEALTAFVPLPHAIVGICDVGEVVLGPRRFVSIQVNGPDDEPVPDVRFTWIDASIAITRRTGLFGTLDIERAGDAKRLRLFAPGFHAREILLPTIDPVEPIHVRLEAAPLLVLRIHGKDDAPLSAVDVVVTSERPMWERTAEERAHDFGADFAPLVKSFETWTTLRSKSISPVSARDNETKVVFALDGPGELAIGGLLPNASIGVEIRGHGEGVILPRRTVVLGPSGETHVDLEVVAETFELRGFVKTPDKKSIGDATVEIRDRETDAVIGSMKVYFDGTFFFRRIYSTRVHLVIRADGFETFEDPNCIPSSYDEMPTFTLTPKNP